MRSADKKKKGAKSSVLQSFIEHTRKGFICLIFFHQIATLQRRNDIRYHINIMFSVCFQFIFFSNHELLVYYNAWY